jgi:hypothetical protein
MTDLDAGRRRGDVINRAVVTVNPRAPSSGTYRVTWTLPQTQDIQPGQSLTFTVIYTDPDTQDRVGSLGDAYVAYSFKSTPVYGFPGNLDAYLTVNAVIGGNSALIEVTNTGSLHGYLVNLELRATILTNYSSLSYTSNDATSQAAYGLNMINMDAPYHADIGFAASASSFVLSQWGDLRTIPDGLTLIGNVDAATMTAVLSIEPGDRITVTETMSAVSAQFIVHGVDFNILPGHIFTSTWTLAPVWDLPAPWLLGTAGSSELGTTTNLGF